MGGVHESGSGLDREQLMADVKRTSTLIALTALDVMETQHAQTDTAAHATRALADPCTGRECDEQLRRRKPRPLCRSE
jgi:hypothetical protein